MTVLEIIRFFTITKLTYSTLILLLLHYNMTVLEIIPFFTITKLTYSTLILLLLHYSTSQYSSFNPYILFL